MDEFLSILFGSELEDDVVLVLVLKDSHPLISSEFKHRKKKTDHLDAPLSCHRLDQ